MKSFTESVVEEASLAWLESLGYAVLHGPDIAAGEPGAERSDPNYGDVALDGRLRRALFRLNPDLPHEALEDACRKLTRSDAPSLVERNRAVRRGTGEPETIEDFSVAQTEGRCKVTRALRCYNLDAMRAHLDHRRTRAISRTA